MQYKLSATQIDELLMRIGNPKDQIFFDVVKVGTGLAISFPVEPINAFH